jgi:hypothetical protein
LSGNRSDTEVNCQDAKVAKKTTSQNSEITTTDCVESF